MLHTMQEIAISRFKATCLAVLKRVQETGEPVRITRFGHPVAEISRPAASQPKRRILGDMAATMRITGDIVAPAFDEKDWDMRRTGPAFPRTARPSVRSARAAAKLPR